MGSADSRRLFTALWLPLFTITMCVGSASSFYGLRREYGVVKPDNPYLFVGEDLVLFCNLTKLELEEDSRFLFFTRDGTEIPASFVEVLTTRSVRLRYPIKVPHNEGHFVCWLRQQKDNFKTIGSQRVQADYSPEAVSGVNCTVYNWENMTCRWDLGRDYHHPEHVHVSLVWTISGTQKDCPAGHMTNTSCTWVNSGPDSFLSGHRYIMSVDVNNTKRGVLKRSRTFTVPTRSIVKPSPVSNLHKNDSNATCLVLVWYHSDLVHDKVPVVQYLSEWNSPHWHNLKLSPFKHGPSQAEICGLTPFTQYTIRVAVRPLRRNDGDGYLSEWRYLQNVRTNPSVPEVAPEMCVGCFTEIPCDRPNCRNLIFYWKHIPWELRRSVINSYQLECKALEGRPQSVNVSTLYPGTSQLVIVNNDTDYTISLFAVTSKNKLSRKHSSLLVPAKANMPEGPASLVVETDYDSDGNWTGQFDLRWSDVGQSTVSFLVAWCLGDLATLKCDHEEKNQMQWQEVSNDTRNFSVKIVAGGGREMPSNYIVGVARQARHGDVVVSSGLTLARCFYRKNTVPTSPKADFAQVNRAGTLHVTWTYDSCSNLGVYVYVTGFVIYYCVITDTPDKRCKGGERNRTVGREARKALLEELQPGAYYKVSMVAVSQWGPSQRSHPPVYSKVTVPPLQEASSNVSIGVVLGVVFLIILIIFGVCKVRRRFQKTREKFIGSSFPELPSLPADDAVKSFKDRPLPKVPQDSSSDVSTTCTSGVGSTVCVDKRQRGGKHKSITSETSLLGNEDAGNDDDSRRRHRSGNSSVSERSKLLAEDGVTREGALCVSKYDSDSGAESRCSSEDHDYASVEGGSGSAEEGAAGTQAVARSSRPEGVGGLQIVAASGYVAESRAATLEAGHKQTGWKPLEHKPAPSYAPPPPPPCRQTGYIQASLVPAHSAVPAAVSSFKPQPKMLEAAGHAQRSHPPAQLTVALEPLKSPLCPQGAPSAWGGYVGTEDPTLPRRPPGTETGPYVPTVRDTPFTTSVDPYASTNVASFSSPPPPAPAPPPSRAPLGKGRDVSQARAVPSQPPPAQAAPAARGYTPHSALLNAASAPAATYSGSTSTSSYNDDSRWSAERGDMEGVQGSRPSAGLADPIYSPPWESNGLVSFVADNRPLSDYMLNLPHNFFDSTLHVDDGPTTEL